MRDLTKYPITFDELLSWLASKRIVVLAEHGGTHDAPVGDVELVIIHQLEIITQQVRDLQRAVEAGRYGLSVWREE